MRVGQGSLAEKRVQRRDWSFALSTENQASSKDTTDRWHLWSESAIVSAIHLLLAVIATYPLILHFTTAVAGGGDAIQNLWNLWWVREAVSHGNLFPFWTPVLYHPTGVSLAFHTLGLLQGWLGALLQLGLGFQLATSYNLITLATFVFTGLTTYLLVRHLTGSPTAAFTSSLVFTFAPIRMSRVMFGNHNLYSTQFLPLTALFTIKMVETRQHRYAALAAVSIAATAWSSRELALGAVLLIILLYTFELARNRHRLAGHIREMAKPWLLFGAVTTLLVTPVVLPMVINYSDFRDQSDQRAGSVYNSSDLLGFFIPDNITQPLVARLSPWVSQWAARTYATFSGNPAEKTVFIGYTVLVLTVALASFSRSRNTRQWVLVACVFFLLSLGPVLHVAGQPVLNHLPFEWLNWIPLIGFGRTPSRLAIFLMLALAVGTGYGLAELERRNSKFRWLTLGVGILIFLEFLVAPIWIDARISEIPHFYGHLPDGDGTAGAILDVPIDLIGAAGPGGRYMLYQIAHERPIIGGYISRTPTKALWLFDQPFLYALRARIYGDTAAYVFDEQLLLHAADDLRLLEVEYVILHRDQFSGPDFRVVRSALETVLSAPIHEDDVITVWQTSAVP